MTLKAPKKSPFPTPLTLTNQHGENYILVEDSNKSWSNVAGEVEKGPRVGCSLSDVDPALGERESHIRGGLC